MKISIYLPLILSCATYVLAAVEVFLAQSCRDYKYLFDKAIPSALSRAKLVFDAMLSLQVNDPVDKMAQLLFGSGKGGGSFDQAHGMNLVMP
ncbi:Dol-P-Man:Man(5)GlcNAc(2)-PP-Dol alpha-1,3-mannosyltransferase [Venturia inaequalis]|nr:Dol-P-Man:Man(5)GlcNAc(2)-PP-Dol alpha-1,3-mannosyltransferase [Venturia inaequalis]